MRRLRRENNYLPLFQLTLSERKWTHFALGSFKIQLFLFFLSGGFIQRNILGWTKKYSAECWKLCKGNSFLVFFSRAVACLPTMNHITKAYFVPIFTCNPFGKVCKFVFRVRFTWIRQDARIPVTVEWVSSSAKLRSKAVCDFLAFFSPFQSWCVGRLPCRREQEWEKPEQQMGFRSWTKSHRILGSHSCSEQYDAAGVLHGCCEVHGPSLL